MTDRLQPVRGFECPTPREYRWLRGMVAASPQRYGVLTEQGWRIPVAKAGVERVRQLMQACRATWLD